MFRFALARFVRPVPCAAIASVALAAKLRPPPTPALCEEQAALEARKNFRVPTVDNEGKGVTMAVGKKLVQLYFSEFADATGKVDLRENLNFTKTKHLLEAAGGRKKDVQKMFDMMDTDNSNTVDYVEIVAYFCGYGVGSINDKASFFFHACDVDGSGTIEKPELKNVLHHMMMLKAETQGRDSFMEWNKTLYAGIPETYVLHLKANELVQDIFTYASKDGEELTEKEFQRWLMRGGKNVNRLTALFNK